MSDVSSLLPAPRLTTDVEHRLFDLAERRMLSPARERGYELRLGGATVLPQGQEIALTPSGKWLLVDHFKDPTAKQYKGKVPIPADQHRRLTKLALAGVRPDLLWLAHELPADWREGDPVPIPAPAHLRAKDERLSRRLHVGPQRFLKGMGATMAAVAAAGARLDPVVLGGVRHPEVPVVQWALLAQWEWE